MDSQMEQLFIHSVLPHESKHSAYILSISVAYRYRKSISIIELFVSTYIDIYRVLGN